ncbi:MAG: transporter substrate-binding domain-containing protein, partial [Treponema sp.]|nr:transporter substrate-binding domain-containing protein [Treponema sp.]
MRIIGRITGIILLVAVLSSFSGCSKVPFGRKAQTDGEWKYHSFRDIPGVTRDEIEAVEKLKGHRDSFVYGMIQSVEAFYDENGEINGFSVLLCKALSKLFDIPFNVEIYEWGDLLAAFEIGEIDFAGDLTPIEERKLKYYMTDPIAQRAVKIIRLANSVPISEIEKTRPPRFVFYKDSTTYNRIVSLNKYDSMEAVFANDYKTIYDTLKSGQADAFLEEYHVEAAFDIYGDVIVEDFFPLTYSVVSMTARNPELEAIISLVQKALEDDLFQYLSGLYTQGYHAYLKRKLFTQLTEEEHAYIQSNPIVRVVAEGGNYPVSFYNIHDGEWQGISYDILRRTAAMTGITFETVNGRDAAWSDLLRMLEKGEVSMSADLSSTNDLKGRFLWSKPYILERLALLTRSSFHDIQDGEIMDLRIGMVGGKLAAEVFPKWFPNHSNFVNYKNSDNVIDALVNGEIDTIMGRMTRLMAITNYYELTGYKANFVFDDVFETSFGFNRDEVVLCSIINKAMRIIDVDKITNSWQNKTYDYKTALEKARLPWLIGVTALLVCVSALMVVLLFRIRNENNKTKSLSHWYESILDAIPLPLTVISMDKNLTLVNTASLNAVGKTKEGLIGKPCKVWDVGICESEKSCLACATRGEKLTYFSVDGLSYQANTELLKDLNGKSAGIIRVVQDITDIERMAKEQADAARIQSEHNRTRLVLDAMPLACFLLDSNFQLSDINEAAVKMFALDETNKSIINFWDYSPKYQPDGSLSVDSASANMKKAFDKGKTVFKWIHQLHDGTPIPVEVTLARIDLGGTPYMAGYMRDLREHNKMMSEIEQRNNLLSAGNSSALLLLGATDERSLDSSIMNSLKVIGHYVTADRVQFWRRDLVDGKLCLNLLYEWTTILGRQKARNAGDKIYFDGITEWSGLLKQGVVINGPFSGLSENMKTALGSRDIKSVLIIPLIIDDNIWGFFSLVDCANEHLFSEDEATAMRSVGLMILNSILRNETDKKLVAAMTEAQSANQAKSSFLANMSHEIRTPMNTIMGITEILMQDEHLNNDAEEGLNRIYNSCNLLLGIINDILDFSRIEAGKLEIISEPYDVASLINDSTQLNKLRFANSPVEFKLQVDENIPETLVGDELRLRQILNNLLSNAFKYTHHGEVKLSVSAETGDGDGVILVFVVSDTGQGMTAEQISRLFNRFTRFNIETNRKIEGAGLGLSITQNLITMMNGSIHVKSEPEKGSVFTVCLPQRHSGSSSVLSKELVENLNQRRAAGAAQVKRTQIIRKYMPYGSVLIVDDTEANLYVAELLMSPYGLKIDTADSGQEAIDRIKSGNVYDIIFMDHMMPMMDGMEAVKIIRGLQYSAPIIALTANAIVGQADIFLTNGFDDFISKPMDMRVLDMSLNKYIYGKQPPQVIEAAQAEKEKIEAQAQAQRPLFVSLSGQEPVPIDISALNAGHGLALFDDDVETYLSALRSYVKNVPETLDKLRGVTEETLPQYAINVHALKSISGWISADSIRTMAANL